MVLLCYTSSACGRNFRVFRSEFVSFYLHSILDANTRVLLDYLLLEYLPSFLPASLLLLRAHSLYILAAAAATCTAYPTCCRCYVHAAHTHCCRLESPLPPRPHTWWWKQAANFFFNRPRRGGAAGFLLGSNVHSYYTIQHFNTSFYNLFWCSCACLPSAFWHVLLLWSSLP